jgi:thiamine biosynthesis lipoprotein
MGSRLKNYAGWLACALGLLFLATSLCRAAEPQNLSRFERTGVHMGVEFEVVLFSEDKVQAEHALDKAFARIAQLDQKLSDYDLQSELSKLSQTSDLAPGAPAADYRPQAVKVSDDLWTVLSYSQLLSRKSDGAFDVTVGPLTKLWRRARRQKELPTAERIEEERAAVGYEHLVLDSSGKAVTLARPNMRLDLGGIAKGYAADQALAEIKTCGISRALVRASGDIAAGEAPPGETGWKIGIAPLNPDDPPQRFVRLAGCGISTSGDARQHLVIDGKRYSHLIDPRSGFGVKGRSSVSVIAPTDMQADAIASAVSVLGPDAGLKLIGQFPGCELLMVFEDESGRQRTVETAGFSRFAEPTQD